MGWGADRGSAARKGAFERGEEGEEGEEDRAKVEDLLERHRLRMVRLRPAAQ